MARVTLQGGASAAEQRALTAGSLGETTAGAINAGTLTGAFTGAVDLSAGTNAISNLGPITFNGNFALNDTGTALTLVSPLNAGAHTVSLNASSLSQLAAAVVTAGTLTGTVTGPTNLGTATNAISNIGAFTSGGAFTLNNGPNALSIVGSLNAANQTVSLMTGTLTESGAGLIIAGSLGGTASSAALGGANQVAALGGFTAPGGFSLTDTVALTVNGPVSAVNGAIVITAPTMTVAPGASPATVSGQSVSLTTVNDLVVNGTIGSCEVTNVSTSGIATLTSSAGAISVSGTVGGQTSVTLSAANGVTISNGLVDGPAVTIGTGLKLTGGQVVGGTVTLNGGGDIHGGTLHANTLMLPNGLLFTSGDLYAGNPLGVTLDTTISGRIVTGGSLTATSLGSVSSSAAIYASGTATIKISGALAQTAGTSLAPSVIAAPQGLTILASGTIGETANASLLTNGALLLSASGTTGATNVSLNGVLAGSSVTVFEPYAGLSFGPSSMVGGATVSIGVTNAAYTCPGCTSSGSGPFTVSALAAPAANGYRPVSLRLDANTLAITSTAVAADTVELHSVGSTTEPGGSLTAALLSNSTAGYLFSSASYAAAGTIPMAAQIPSYAPLTSPTTANTTGGSATLDSVANDIAMVKNYQVRGDVGQNGQTLTTQGGLTLIDAPGVQTGSGGTQTPYTTLTLLGTITAGSAPDLTPTPTAALATQYGAPISITTNSDLLLGTTTVPLAANVSLTGYSVSLNTFGTAGIAGTASAPALPAALGNLTETAGSVITASSLSGVLTPNAMALPAAMLPGNNQISTLGGFTAPGGFLLTDTVGLTVNGPVSAVNGAIVITAPTMTVAAGASPATVSGESVSLTTVNDLVVNGTIGSCEVTNVSTSGITTLTSSAGAISVAGASAVIGGQTSVTLSAADGVTISNGLVNGPTVTIGTGLALTGGQVVGSAVTLQGSSHIDGGSLHADTLVHDGLLFTSGNLYAGSGLAGSNNGAGVTLDTTISGQIATRGDLIADTVGSVSNTAGIYALGSATVTLGSGSSFNQGAAIFAAGNNLTITAPGVITEAAGGSLEAANTLLLNASGTGSAAINGTVAGTTIQVVEPNLALTIAPVATLGAPTVQVGLANTFECPGCTPPGTASSLVTASAMLSQSGQPRPAALLLDGSTLTLGATIAADSIELHSLGSTSQPSGSLVTNVLTGTEGYAPVLSAALPVYSPQTTTGVSGGTVMLTSATNNIGQVNGYVVRGDDASGSGLVLVDAPAAQVNANAATVTPAALTLTGTIASGPGNNPATVTAAAEAAGNNVSITVAGANGNLVIGTATQSAAVLGNLVGLTTSGAQTEAASSSVVANVLTGSAASVALPGPNQVTTLGSITAPGGFQLTDTTNLSIVGPVSAASGAVNVSALATTIYAPPSGPTISGANVTLLTTQMVVFGTIGSCSLGDTATGNTSLTASSGSITLYSGAVVGGQTSASLTAGTINQAGASLIDGPSVTLAGNFNQSAGRVVGGAVAVTGSLTQTGGSIWSGSTFTATAPQVAGTVASGSNVTLTNVSSVSGTVTADGSVSIAAPGGSPLTLSGTVVAGQNLSIVQGTQGVAGSGGGITQSAGALSAGGAAVIYASDGATNQTGGTLAANTVQVVALAGDNTFTPSVQPVLGSGRVGVPVMYLCPGCTNNSADPGSPGTLSASLGSIRPASVLLDGTTLTLSRAVAGDTVELHSTGATTVTGPVSAGMLFGTAGYSLTGFTAGLPSYSATAPTVGSPGATFSNPSNAVQRLGPYQTPGAMVFTDAPNAAGLTIAGLVATGSLSLNLTGPQGNLIIGDAMSPNSILTGSTLAITTQGTITEAAGSAVGAATLTGRAASVLLPGANQIATIGTFAAPGGFVLNDVTGLQFSGAFTGGAAALTVGGGLIVQNGATLNDDSFNAQSGGAASVAGSLVTSGPLTLQAAGISITGTVQSANASISLTSSGSLQQAGILKAGTKITTTATGSATVFSGATTAGQALVITAGSATLSGSESAPLLTVSAPSVTLSGGTIATGGVPQLIGATVNDLPKYSPAQGTGAFFEVGSTFSQLGTTTVTALGAPNVSFVVDLTSPQGLGKVTFQGLQAPTTNLILNLGLLGSASGGPLTLNNLFVTYTSPGNGTVDLTGTIDGKAGVVAAGASSIYKAANRDYRLNSCAISSVNCIVLQPTLVPVGNPLKELTLNFFREQDETEDLIVPNITDQGL